MNHENSIPENPGTIDSSRKLPQAISLEETKAIAGEVHALIKAGDERSAWERVQNLHPADLRSIVAGLPRAGRDAMVHVMAPETVAWMLGQLSPVEAARVGTRLGSRVLSSAPEQINPQQALETLLRLPTARAREVANALEQPLPDAELLAHARDTAGALMVLECPTVVGGSLVGAARDSLRGLGDNRGTSTPMSW